MLEGKRRENKTKLGQCFSFLHFLSSPLTLSSLETFVLSFWLGFLCRRIKELLRCHELSGPLILPVLSWKTARRTRLYVALRNSCSKEPTIFHHIYLRTHKSDRSVLLLLTLPWHFQECLSEFLPLFRRSSWFLCNHLHALQPRAELCAAQFIVRHFLIMPPLRVRLKRDKDGRF